MTRRRKKKRKKKREKRYESKLFNAYNAFVARL
jgi:hypothetical protein